MKKQIALHWKTFSAVGMAVVAVLVFITAIGSPAGAQESSNPTRSISVTGSGDASGAPDIAYVNLGVDIADKDISVALEKANSTMQALTAAITDTGVKAEDVQTINFNVYPEYNYDPQSGQSTDVRTYHVQNSVNVTVRDIAKVGAVIEAGLGAGANSVNGLTFGIADMKKLEEQARLKAVADARDRAGQLASAFNVTLGEPITISESYSGGLPVFYAQRDVAQTAGGATPQISPGQLTVSVQVNVTFSIGS